MSKFYPTHAYHKPSGNFGANRKKPSPATRYIPYTSFPKHVLWLPPAQQLNHISLTRELDNFIEYVQLDEKEEQCRSSIIMELEHIVQNLFPGAQVSLFGSCAGGLSTFISDLDLTVLFPSRYCEGCTWRGDASLAVIDGIIDKRTVEGGPRPDTQCSPNEHKAITYEQEELRVQNAFNLETLFEALKGASFVDRIEHRPRARVPIVNLSHRCGIECDISMDVPFQSTLYAVRALVQRCGPALVKLSAFLKIYLNQLGLDAPFTGGLGSYKLYILLAKRIDQQPPDMALGDRLINFLGYYGEPKNLNEHSIVEVAGAEAATFERTSQVQELQSAFAIAHRVLQDAAKDAQNPEQTKKKYICCTPASCSALAALLDTERLCQERVRRRTLCHQYVASCADNATSSSSVSVLHQEEAADSTVAEVLSQNGEVKASGNNNHQSHRLSFSTSSESLVDLHKQLDILKSRLLGKRLSSAGWLSQNHLCDQDISSSSIEVASTSILNDPGLVFSPADITGKLIVAGIESLPVHMTVSEDNKVFLPVEIQQRLGPFRNLHLAERYTHKSLEELERLQSQHHGQVAKWKEALNQAPVPPSSSSLRIFSPLTAYGKLILAGELPVPPQMKITLVQQQRIEEEQHCRDCLAKLIKLRRDAVNWNHQTSSFPESVSVSSYCAPTAGSSSLLASDLEERTDAPADSSVLMQGSKSCDDTASIESFSACDVDFDNWGTFCDSVVGEMNDLPDAIGSDGSETLSVTWFIDRAPAPMEQSPSMRTAITSLPSINPLYESAPNGVSRPSAAVAQNTHTSRNSLAPSFVSKMAAEPPSSSRAEDTVAADSQTPYPQQDHTPTSKCTMTSSATTNPASSKIGDLKHGTSLPAPEVTSSSEGSASKPGAKRPLPPVMQFQQSKALSRTTKPIDTVVLSPLASTEDSCLNNMKQEAQNGRTKRQKREQMKSSDLLSEAHSTLPASNQKSMRAVGSPKQVSNAPGKPSTSTIEAVTVAKDGPQPCTVVTRSVTPQQEAVVVENDTPIVTFASTTESALATVQATAKNPTTSQARASSQAPPTSTATSTLTTTYTQKTLLTIQLSQSTTTTMTNPQKIAKKPFVPTELLTNVAPVFPTTNGAELATSSAAPTSRPRRADNHVYPNRHSGFLPASSFGSINIQPTQPIQQGNGYAPMNIYQNPFNGGTYMPSVAPQFLPLPPPPPPLQVLPAQGYISQPQNIIQQPSAVPFVQAQLYQHQLTHYQDQMLHNGQYQPRHQESQLLLPPPPLVVPVAPYSLVHSSFGQEPLYHPQPPPMPPQPLPPAPVLQVPPHELHGDQYQLHWPNQSASLSYAHNGSGDVAAHEPFQPRVHTGYLDYSHQYYNGHSLSYPQQQYQQQYCDNSAVTNIYHNPNYHAEYYTPTAPPQPPPPM